MRAIPIFVALLALPLLAQQQDVVARVGSATITRADLAAEIPDEYKPQYARVTKEFRDTQRQAVRELLGTRNIEAAAKRRHVDPEVIYTETIAHDAESFTVDAQAKIHQIEASVYEADRLTLEEVIERRLFDEGVRRKLAVDTAIAADDVAYLRAYEASRRTHASSKDPVDKQIGDAAAEARAAVLRARMVAAARGAVPVERLLEPPRVHVATAGFPRLGDAHAPVEIVVFTDFECPYCAETEPILKELLQRRAGDVTLVMRDYPMANRIHAMPSAIAARCALAQGKYWPYHDLLFANRTKLTEENFRQLAASVGMDADALARCEADPATRAAIEREVEQGRAYGVEATPTLFVNGRLLSGMRTLENLLRLVDEEKEKGGPKAASH